MTEAAKYFPDPNTFIPERWTTRPDLLLNRDAFAPFSLGSFPFPSFLAPPVFPTPLFQSFLNNRFSFIGPFNCVGRNLALLQLRIALALVTRKFDIELATGETGRGLMEESVDAFTMTTGALWLVFKERETGKA